MSGYHFISFRLKHIIRITHRREHHQMNNMMASRYEIAEGKLEHKFTKHFSSFLHYIDWLITITSFSLCNSIVSKIGKNCYIIEYWAHISLLIGMRSHHNPIASASFHPQHRQILIPFDSFYLTQNSSNAQYFLQMLAVIMNL